MLNSFILSISCLSVILMIKRINEQLLLTFVSIYIYIVVINYVMKAFHNNFIFKFDLCELGIGVWMKEWWLDMRWHVLLFEITKV